jgi:hypothetical protein
MDAVIEKESDISKNREASEALNSNLSVLGILDTAANVYNGVRMAIVLFYAR